jgi:hypothetical protein
MIVGGDELGRTQQGNNNAYCQDNRTTWFDWSAVDKDLLAFTRHLVALRQAHPVFRRRRFLIGAEAAELLWFTPAGTPMTEAEWRDPDARSLALYLGGADAPDLAADGSPMLDDDFLLLVNAWWEPIDFTIPPTRPGQTWLREIDTSTPQGPSPQPQRAPPTRSQSDPFRGRASSLGNTLTAPLVSSRSDPCRVAVLDDGPDHDRGHDHDQCGTDGVGGEERQLDDPVEAGDQYRDHPGPPGPDEECDAGDHLDDPQCQQHPTPGGDL